MRYIAVEKSCNLWRYLHHACFKDPFRISTLEFIPSNFLTKFSKLELYWNNIPDKWLSFGQNSASVLHIRTIIVKKYRVCEFMLVEAISFDLFCSVQRWGLEFSSYEIKSRNQVTQMTSRFELLTRKFLNKFVFRVTSSTSWNIELNFEELTRRFNCYFSTFGVLTQSWKMKNFTSSY